MSYIDGFLLVVPKKKLKDYKKMAALGGKIWMKHGALQYIEAASDDIKKQKWAKNSFAKAANAKPSDYVFFSFIVFKNKKHRDVVNKKVMSDPAMLPEDRKSVV